jgi:hypothetical protein
MQRRGVRYRRLQVIYRPLVLDTKGTRPCFVQKHISMATPQQVTTRRLTICNKAYARKKGRYVSFPIISLNGKWLQQTGFRGGQVIDIACEECRLIITLAKEQRFENV